MDYDASSYLAGMLIKADAVRQDTFPAIADVTGEKKLRQFRSQKKGEKIKVCKAIDILIAEGEKRGIAKEKKNTERERRRAEKAEARIRKLERMMKA